MSRIIVKNLPQSGVSEEQLKRHFSDIDNVTEIKLKFNEMGKFRRFAFIGFKSSDGADRAIERLNNSFIKNSKIALEACKAVREIKADKVLGVKRKINNDDSLGSDGEDKHEPSSSEPNRKPKKAKKNKKLDPFEEVKDESEFKEFLGLQRNIENKESAKQIWSDDVVLKASTTIEAATKTASDEDQSGDDDKEGQEGDRPAGKRHKRSRGKGNKPTKTKPKELFVHTAKIQGLPSDARRKDIKDFFKPLELLSIRLNKRDETCYVSFKDESDLKFGMRKNLHFFKTSRIKMWHHDVNRSRLFREKVQEKSRVREDNQKKYATALAEAEPIEESGRLFVRNLNYTCTQEDLEQVFSTYGQLTEVELPIDRRTSNPKGFAYVEFMFPKDAARAYEELNGTIFQGRNFHLIPSKPKPEPRYLQQMPVIGGAPGGQRVAPAAATTTPTAATPATTLPTTTPGDSGTHQSGAVQQDGARGELRAPGSKLSTFKHDKLMKEKEMAPKKASNWNILFLGQNALANVASGMRGVEKSDLLTKQTQREPVAVRLALADAMLVDEMRKFLVSNGIELDSFDNPTAPRSRTVIIVKNLPSSGDKAELQSMFEAYGRVGRLIMPPNGLTAIVEMEEPTEAKFAFKKLAYRKYKGGVLYLEWAPINVFREKSLEEQERADVAQLAELQTGTKILVKNVPFEASLAELRKLFAAYGELNFVRLPKKIDGQHRGFGFVDYLTKEEALRAFRSLCHSTHLYGRKLVLEWAKSDQGSS